MKATILLLNEKVIVIIGWRVYAKMDKYEASSVITRIN